MEKRKFKVHHHVARKLIEHAREQERHVTPEELDDLWRHVEEQVFIEKRKNSRRHILYVTTALSAAVIFFCIFWLGKQFIPFYADDDSIADFAKYAQVEEATNKDILLLIPGKTDVVVKDTDVNIIYSHNGTVVVNSDTIDQRKTLEKEREFNQLIIPKGKRTRLTLADGTHLWANSGTRVVYPSHFEKNRREIYVEGEVYLDVFRNESAPFIVKTKDFQVQVLGTVFNVSAYPSEGMSSVVLVTGSVNVKNYEKEQVKLAPGQLVNIHTGQLNTPKNVDIEPYVCWVKNMLMYTDEPLDRVFKKLNLYYGREFILEPEVKEMLVSGKLDLKEKLEDVLHTISFSAPIYYEKFDDKIYVRKERMINKLNY